jgi:hypothetical protein
MTRILGKKNGRATSIENICFPVEVRNNPRTTNKEYSKVVVGIIDGQEWDLNYCSDVYTLIPNADVFPNVERILNEKNIGYSVDYRVIDNVRFYADYNITDSDLGYRIEGTNDVIQPMIRVQHSYNGLTKYQIKFGYFRLVCSNGLTIPVEEMKEFNLCITGKHTESIKHSFLELEKMIIKFGDDAHTILKTITAKYQKLANKPVIDTKKRITEILEGTQIAMINNSKYNTLNDITARIIEEINNPQLGYNGQCNDWLIYNGINQYLNDDNLNVATPEARQDKDIKVLEYMLQN